MNTRILLALLALVAASSAVLLNREPFIRLIPADVLRDFRTGCFASTQCKVFAPNETWPLTPYCGRSRCVALRTDDKKIRLAEEVTECGPQVDLDKTKGCKLLEGQFKAEDPFPDCCPKYDCEEGVDVIFVNRNETSTKSSEEAAEGSGSGAN